MPKFAKKFLIIAGAIALVFGIALLIVNLYLQSEGVQSRIREVATASLGAPVNVGGSLYTPWGGFVIRSISVPNPNKPKENLLEADSLRIRFSLFSLLGGQFLIKQVVLANPIMISRQDAEGNWMILVPPPPKQEIPVTIPDKKAPSGKSFKVTLENIRIQGARAVFIDARGKTIMRFEKADFEAKIQDHKTCAGVFDIGNMDIVDALKPRRIGGPFTWDGRVLDMPEITGSLAGGKLLGKYHLETGEAPVFQMAMSASEVKLKKLAEDSGGRTSGTAGHLNGQVNISGDPRHTDSFAGTASMDLIEAKLTPVDFLVQFGQMFGIEELQVLKLREATSKFTIAGGEVRVDSMVMKSENLMLTGEGVVAFDGDLDIDAALHVNRKLQRNLKAVMGKNFVQTDDPDFKKLEFQVMNTLANPRTDLLDKLVGAKVGQDLGGLLQNLFRAPAPKKEKQPEGSKN